MTPRQQRFCPLCERAFAEGEAVLRCEGCGILHHPACWVKNNGCKTNTEHQSVPVALAYASERFAGGEAPHPGEGTRVTPVDPARQPIELRQRPQAAAQAAAPSHADEGGVIGASTSATPPRTLPPTASAPSDPQSKPKSLSRSYRADRAGKPLPSVYGRHRFLQFWYVPAALLLAAGVAVGVIWVAGLFDGEDSNRAGDEDPPSTTVLSTPSASVAASGSPATPGAAAGTATASVSPATGGKFQLNDVVVVTGVGAGTGNEAGCLNIRTEPGTGNPAIVCVPDGTQLTVLGGPQESGGLKWWKLRLTSGEGWAAEDYLTRR